MRSMVARDKASRLLEGPVVTRSSRHCTMSGSSYRLGFSNASQMTSVSQRSFDAFRAWMAVTKAVFQAKVS